jgi:predicted ATPase
MAEQNGTQQSNGITGITVSGFKSLRDESHIDVRPLTILAGANSSGKSSIMQPLLLMKQTLEAPYDPGALLLNGPNVKFTAAEQFLWKANRVFANFKVNLETESEYGFINTFEKQSQKPQIQLIETVIYHPDYRRALRADMTQEEIEHISPKGFKEAWGQELTGDLYWQVRRKRCFLGLDLVTDLDPLAPGMGIITDLDDRYLIRLIHVAGLRPNPERSYPYSATNHYSYPGTFESYVASIINDWQQSSEDKRLLELSNNLTKLGLTSQISTKPINETQIELRVGRTLSNNGEDLVNVADVGFGISQVLPVLVALLVADPSYQLVYIEQPELHLHPRAQVALAQVLADAANRGVRVVAETHSSLLLLGIQTLIAEGKLTPDKVMLHWFTRGDDGATTINSVEPDENGAYGNWPVDFDDVELETQRRYLDQVALREMST